MDNDKIIEILERTINDLKDEYQARIEELREKLEEQKNLSQALIDEKEQRIQDLKQQIADLKQEVDQLKQQQNEKDNQPTQTFYFQGANISGGVAGRDYTGNVINHIKQLLEDEKELQVLFQQLDQPQLIQLKQIIETLINKSS